MADCELGRSALTRTEATETLTVPEAAARLGIGRTMAWRMVASGELPSIRLGGRDGRGGRVVISKRVIDAMLAAPKSAQ